MSRDYRMPDYSPYLHMHELQPAEAAPLAASTPAGQHYPYPPRHQQLSNSSTTPAYEMTSAGSACASGGTLPPAPSLHHLDPRKRKSSHFDGDYELSDTQCSGSERSEAVGGGGGGGAGGSTRNRNSSSFGTASVYDDDCGEDTRSSHANTSAMPDKKQNHSEIEKRRRDKMNTYITELSSMIPMCGAISRKLDKLTVLRMAVQHLRTLRGSLSACPFTARPRPAFVSERELNGLLLQAASNSFLIVVSCDRGRLLYVSHSVSNMLHYDQSELLGQSMFDILHPKDVAKVKEQLSSSDLSPRERLIDAKTMLPVKSDAVAGAQRLGTGARRSFFCRIKCKQEPQQNSSTTPASVKEEAEANTNHRKKKYCVVQCTGYLKSWAPAEIENESCPEGDDEQFTMSCLVAVGRALTDLIPPHAPAPQTRRLQYVSRHAIDGKFLFVDPRVTLALGFLPQELLGTSLYEYVIGPELGAVVRTHKQALISQDPLHTPPYSFRRKDGTIATVQTHFKPFRNPWTKDVECLVANNSIVSDPPDVDKLAQQQYEAFKQTDEWRDYLTGIKDDRSDDERGCEPSGGGGGAGRRAGDDERAGEPTGGVAVAGGGNGGDSNDANPSSSESNAEVQRLIDSQVESHKIGSAIADEAFRCPPSPDQLSPLPAHLLQDPTFNASLMDNILGVDLNPFTVRNNVIQSTAVGQPPSPARGSVAPAASASPPLGLDGNGEAAMAVIMSLLEADAGLGGPVNISGLPWPLP